MTSNLFAPIFFVFLRSFSKLVIFQSKILLVVSVLICLESLKVGPYPLLLIKITGDVFKNWAEPKQILTWAWYPRDPDSLILGEILGFCVLKSKMTQPTNR